MSHPTTLSTTRLLILAALLVAVGLASSPASAQVGPEEFTANLIDAKNALPGAASAYFWLRITEYGDEKALQNLLNLLKEEGQDGLRRRLENQEVGRVQLTPRETALPVAFARTFPEGDGRVVRAVVARPIGFLEASRSLRTRDYPFSIVELRLDEDGRGSGVFVAATKIEFDKQGNLVVESYGIEPFQLLNARKKK
jgi:hypothetical protein